MRGSVGLSEKKGIRVLSEELRASIAHFSMSYSNTDCDLGRVKTLALKQILNEVKEGRV